MRHVVVRQGGMGFEEVFVEAATGDEAALKAFKPGMKIVYVGPAPKDEAAGLKAERQAFVGRVAAEELAKG